MLIFQFSLYPTHHHLHARGVFNSFFFIITLNLTTITLRPVKRENQLNSHFLLHRLPFYVSFFLDFISRCLFIILLLVWAWACLLAYNFFPSLHSIASLSFSGSVCIWLSHSHHSSRFINLQPFAAHSIKIKRDERKNKKEKKETWNG